MSSNVNLIDDLPVINTRNRIFNNVADLIKHELHILQTKTGISIFILKYPVDFCLRYYGVKDEYKGQVEKAIKKIILNRLLKNE